MMALIELFEIN